MGIVANARSGVGGGRRQVERLMKALAARGLAAHVAWTLEERAALVGRARGDAECRCLVVVGGDGTVSDLINEDPGVPLAVLPSGTENLFARHFGFRRRPVALAERIAHGTVTWLDLGRADGRRFALMAGFGFDADVVTRHHRARVRGGSLRTTHRGAYVAPVLQASLEYRFPPLEVTVEGADSEGPDTLVGTTVFVFNLPRYALGLPFAPSARGDDGLLDLVLFPEPGPWRALRYLWLVWRGLHLHQPGVVHRRVRRVTVATDEPVPVQLDGDPAGRVEPGRPWTVEVLPRAVSVLLPAGRAAVPAGPER